MKAAFRVLSECSIGIIKCQLGRFPNCFHLVLLLMGTVLQCSFQSLLCARRMVPVPHHLPVGNESHSSLLRQKHRRKKRATRQKRKEKMCVYKCVNVPSLQHHLQVVVCRLKGVRASGKSAPASGWHFTAVKLRCRFCCLFYCYFYPATSAVTVRGRVWASRSCRLWVSALEKKGRKSQPANQLVSQSVPFS